VKFTLALAGAAAVVSAAPSLEPERLPPGPLPGKPVHGKLGGDVRDVRELVAVGTGYRRVRLLIGRGRGDRLCVAGVAGARRPGGFRCMARWDRAPLIVRVGVGGRSRARPDWLSLVGLVRPEVDHVTVEKQLVARKAVPLRDVPGFPFRVFAVPPGSGSQRPDFVRAHDRTGGVMQRIDTGWADRSPCMQKKEQECRNPAERRGKWSAARDPFFLAQTRFIKSGGESRSKRLATAHPVVRQLVSRQPFSFDAVAEWTRCNGRRIGAVVELQLSRPVDFEGDVPVQGNAIKTAYTEGVAHLRVTGYVIWRIYVDLNRRKVVAIYPEDDLLDGREGGRPKPTYDFKLLGPLRPAGGPDQGKPCETKPGA
jgi:hypothetical protein